MKRLAILGSTGSIGEQALDVVATTEGLEVVALSAHARWERAVEQARALGLERIALSDPQAARLAAAAWPDGEVLAGPAGVIELIAGAGADLVLNAIVGSAGLVPTVVALSEGVDVALANKESLVAGGELVMALSQATGARILPVDSEHAALAQLIGPERANGPGTIERLTITASGGPFRGRTRAELEAVTPDQALAHPTWTMGAKITIDSATLMNKGLEVIEAHHLFELPYERIDVIVHPQSIVHGMITLCDGAVLAHLGCPDMRVPIAYALHHPERAALDGVARLDLASVGALTFEAPDTDAFRALALAREAASAGGTAPCVLNAANEVAVHAFLERRIAFTRIAEVIEAALDELGADPLREFEALLEVDRRAREVAAGAVGM
jgi:1-deoxy-D-xylulose-5-phosphate reductoisomerase